MRIEPFKTLGVSKDGKVKGGGAVTTTGCVLLGRGEGCGLDGCHCSDGYWISIVEPLKNGVVKGVKVNFKNIEEFERFLDKGVLLQ